MKGPAPTLPPPGVFSQYRRMLPVLLLVAAGLSGCSSGSQSTAPASTVTQFAPVTSPELATTTTTTARLTTTLSTTSVGLGGSGAEGGDDSVGGKGVDASGETDDEAATDPVAETETEEDNLTLIEQRLTAALGPTGSLSTTLDELLIFPVRVATPAESTIVEVAVGVGSLLPRSSEDQPTSARTIVQVSGTIRTTSTANEAFALMGGSLVRAGLLPIDSATAGPAPSRSYRIPNAGRFDEVVMTALDQPGATGSLVRVTYNGTSTNSSVALFRDWAGQPLPLPQSDQLRTILTINRSGEGRLQSTNLTISSSAIVVDGNAQREANRLVQRVLRAAEDDTSRLVVLGGIDDSNDAPLVGVLGVEGLDKAGYEIVPTQQVDVDPAGELEQVDVIEVRLTGTKVVGS